MVFVSTRRMGFFSLTSEEALAGPEHHREDDLAQLIDQVVLQKRAPETITGIHDYLPLQLVLQLL